MTRSIHRTVAALAIAWFAGGVTSGCADEGPGRIWDDDFSDVQVWVAHPATDVQMRLGSDTVDAPVDTHAAAPAPLPPALRIDFTYPGGGWAIARRDVDLVLPENYAFSFWVRGETGPQTLEFKLVDDSGENVWWSVRSDFAFDETWRRVRVRKRDLDFAWGPQGGGALHRVGAIEIAITAGSGGTGTVWIDDLALDELDPPLANPPRPGVIASSEQRDAPAAHGIDGEASTMWSPNDDDEAPSLVLDLRVEREFGGITLDWAPGRHAADYDVEASDDGVAWRRLTSVRGSNGGRDWLWLPDQSASWLRLVPLQGASEDATGLGLAEITLQTPDWAPRREDLLAKIAATRPRGSHPRALHGEQNYWTVVGLDGDVAESLMGEDGAIELGPWRPSLEPLLEVDGRVLTWADVERTCGLREGDLPLPWVRWRNDDLVLEISATPIGEPGLSSIAVRYRVLNLGRGARTPTLHLALRALQVNPPVQFLNRPGGTAPIHRLRLEPATITIDDRPAVVLLDAPAHLAASTFHGGDIVAEHLLRGSLPRATEVDDPEGGASGLLSYPLTIAAGDSVEIALSIPLHASTPLPPADRARARQWLATEIERSAARWRAALDRVEIRLPERARWIENSLRTQVAYVLVNRDGPAIQPGSRSYARSWIRDGALTSSAMLRMGHPEVAREFLEWFAPFQFDDGKIPCVVDARGGDPVPEHDSSGQFIHLVAELLRMEGDRALAERMWPRVDRAAAYLDSLRQLRRTEEYTHDDQRVFYGLLPESISHEGYSTKPMHSYWDDFWAVRGFHDAARIAEALGHAERSAHWKRVHAEFVHDVARSIERALEVHGIDYVPGCAELGDFDATSTTIALSPTGAGSILPSAAVHATFERYWKFFVDRRDGAPWEAYTPYELRNVGAFVHLGWRERAHELLTWFREHQRPAGWNHWAEVVVNPERMPRFLGDMPHTWVGSDFVRAVLDMFAYVDGDDDVLVLAAGVPADWIEAESGVVIRDLPTPFGSLDLILQREAATWITRIGGDLRVPDGGIFLRLPLPEDPVVVSFDGESIDVENARDLRIDRVPITVTVHR